MHIHTLILIPYALHWQGENKRQGAQICRGDFRGIWLRLLVRIAFVTCFFWWVKGYLISFLWPDLYPCQLLVFVKVGEHLQPWEKLNYIHSVQLLNVEGMKPLPWSFKVGSELSQVTVREPLVLYNDTNPSLNVLRHWLVDWRTQVQAHWKVVRDLSKQN